MNMHMPQNILAETELRHIAAIPYQIVSPAINAPLVGIYQDSMLGCYQFTRPDIYFSPREAMNLLMMYSSVDTKSIREAGGKVSNFQILSQILKPITLNYKNKLYTENPHENNIIEIRNGQWIRGQIEKSVMGSTTKGVLHRIFNDFGPMACANFIDDLQNIITEYMKTCSFSVGISDLIANKTTMDSIIQAINKQKIEVQSIIEKIHLGIFENNTANDNMTEFESQVNRILNKATDESGRIGRDSLSKDNRFLQIVSSGSKGNLINISQMISGLGQQNVDGKRIPYGFDSRTLPHYFKYDDSPAARGFVENSYISGLTAPELFFHAMGGRIGLIDTAVKSVTWETPIVIIENGCPVYTFIGRWIDSQLKDQPNQIQYTPEDRNMELLKLTPESVYIPTPDENGNIVWGEVTAITRHDPGNRLYKIVTQSGRKVTVAESQSLLVWDQETVTFQPKPSPDVQVGEFVPITTILNDSQVAINPSLISNIFELDEDNGKYLGIFEAAGYLYKNYTVFIRTNSEEIKQFVCDWYDSFEIVYECYTDNDPNYTMISCGDGDLYQFLQNWTVSNSFMAPTAFVKGILEGYYSIISEFDDNLIKTTAPNMETIDALSLLASRIGVFGSISKDVDSPEFTISNQWGRHLVESLKLLDSKKQAQFEEIMWGTDTRQISNDVLLDPIISIVPIGIDENPKLYDITVPSTLNFCLANGLGVRDTSQTGYIQRRLIKGLEDIKVEYDMTVRNSKGVVVQFAYGEDGFDTTRVENQIVPLTGMSLEDIYLHYDILGINEGQEKEILNVYTNATITRMKKQKSETQQLCKKYIDKMIQNRNIVVKSVFKNKNDNTVKIPVAFQNIIANIQGQMHLNANSIVDITPMECFQLVESYYEKLKKLEYVQPNLLFELLYFYYLSPKDLLVNKRFHSKALVVLLETILLKYKQAIVHPGEMVGIIAGHSVGEPSTQMTLNSVTYETAIMVRNKEGLIKNLKIGDFTKEHIEKSKKIDYMEEKDTTYAELSEYYEVPCATEDGRTVWRRIEAVTKHPVINKDGTNTMLKITTKGGRDVTVTKAKSLLQLIDGKIQQVEGASVKVGDYLPVSRKQLDFAETYKLNLKEILPPSKYIYGSEMEKAKQVVDEHHWWSKHANKSFIIPYSRSDSAYAHLKKTCGKRNPVEYKPGFVYTKTNSSFNYKIPECIELDYDFGYLLGAYAAEGCMTAHQISISNIAEDFYAPILRICNKFNLTTKVYTYENKGKEGWRSRDIRIYSTILCNILENLCGKLSHNKYVSDKIVFSNKECIRGFLDAYISGDGSIYCDTQNCISATSTSYNMLLDIQIMMKQLGITAKIYTKSPLTKDVVFPTYITKLENVHQCYELRIANQQCKNIANILNLSIKYKQDKILELRNKEFKYEYCRENLLLPNIVNSKLVFENRNNNMMDLEFDMIIDIKEVPNTTPYAYDLTVEDTRNFDIYNGICLAD